MPLASSSCQKARSRSREQVVVAVLAARLWSTWLADAGGELGHGFAFTATSAHVRVPFSS